MKAQRLLGLGCSALCLVAAPRLAHADDPNELEALLAEPVVATASKSAESSSLAPAMTSVITAEDLRRYGVRSLDEAINLLSVGMVTETPAPTAEIGARGVLLSGDFGTHVLLLIDGHQINEVWGGTAYFDRGAGIPLEIVDHIEVILGPGSVLYGSNAMLGVINVVTKRARDFDGIHFVTEGEVMPGGEKAPGWSMRGGAGAGFAFDIGKTPAELTFMAEMYGFHGPAYKFGPQDYGNDSVTGEPRRFSSQTPPGVWGGVASESYYTRVPSGFVRFVVGDFELRVRAELFDRASPFHGGDFDDPENHEVDRWVSADARYRIPIGSRVTLNARLYGDLYDYHQAFPSSAREDCLDGQDRGCVYDLVGIARWTGLELSGSFDWLGDGRITTLIGVDGRVKNVESRIDIYDLVTKKSPGLQDAYNPTELAVGLYAEQSARLAKWLAVNGGVRLDADQRYGANFSPRAAVVLSPWGGSAFKAIYAQAFRAPTAFEQYYADTTSQIVPVNLQPETVRSIEGSFEQRVGSHRIEVGVFRTYWEDLVLTHDLTPDEIATAVARGQLEEGVTSAEQTRNVSKIDAYGFTAAIEGSAASNHVHYGASVTRARARRTEPDEEAPLELAASAQIIGNARIAYDFQGPYPEVGLVGRFAGERPVEATQGGGSSVVAPPQTELRLTVSGPFPKLKGLSYRLSGSYAFADRYPYAIGPAQLADGSPELAPVDQAKVALGLRYDIVP